VVNGRACSERDVGPDQAGERASADAGELPEIPIGAASGCERIAVGFDTAFPDNDDGVRTELREGVVLGGLSEGDESEIHTLRRPYPDVGSRRAARLFAGGAPELALRLDPTAPDAEEVCLLTILPVGHEGPIADHDVLEGSNGRKLCIDFFAFIEEGQIKTGFHRQEA
jgi:hypothetical protein